MNIKELTIKLQHSNLEIDLNEESLNFPILKVMLNNKKCIFYYRENFIQRTKFHKKYKTYLEINIIDNADYLILKNKIERHLDCNYCINDNKFYLNINKFEVMDIISFIEKIK